MSSRGFTDGVIEKAKGTDVELLTIEQAKVKKWAQTGPQRMQFRVSPHLHGIEIVPPLPVVDPKFAILNSRVICRAGHDHGKPLQLANCIFFHQWLPANVERFKEIERQVLAKHKGNGILTMTMPLDNWNVMFGGSRYPIQGIKLHVHLMLQEGPVTHRRYHRRSSKGGTRYVDYIQGVAGNKKLSFVIPWNGPLPDKSPMTPEQMREIVPKQISLKIGDVDKPTKQPRRKRNG